MSRRGWLTVVVPVGLVLLVGSWVHYEYTRYEKAYARLIPGTARAEVLQRFGKPGDITKCSDVNRWDETNIDQKSMKCVEEFHYFSRVRIGDWVVGFDEDGRVVTKYFSSSP
ncbi:MAG: hypothetical protein LAN36_04605 [Acidobacteriia bacterium]|nr:hypothetical protein [Terriglobia bacterium]